MTTLTANEARTLGVLVEKAQTTPAQYPLTLNALTAGCNQKNNRDPVTDFSEEDVLEAIDGLRAKGFVREAILSGSRVNKYRHVARDVLQIGTGELVILAELLLRGPQSVGEIRGRASRMHPLESIESTQAALDAMASRDEPLVASLGRQPGERSVRFAQLLCPGLHPVDAPASVDTRSGVPSSSAGSDLAARVARLEAVVRQLAEKLGESELTKELE